jgi:hypothetical protein
MRDGVLVFTVGEAKIRPPDGWIFARDFEDAIDVEVALVRKTVLAGKDALAAHVA